jgi:hypothetical protein
MASENSPVAEKEVAKADKTEPKKKRFKTRFNILVDGKTIEAGGEVALNEDQWTDLKAMGAIEGDWSN